MHTSFITKPHWTIIRDYPSENSLKDYKEPINIFGYIIELRTAFIYSIIHLIIYSENTLISFLEGLDEMKFLNLYFN